MLDALAQDTTPTRTAARTATPPPGRHHRRRGADHQVLPDRRGESSDIGQLRLILNQRWLPDEAGVAFDGDRITIESSE
jgi:hypothetical protein